MAHVALIAGEGRRKAVYDAVHALGAPLQEKLQSAKTIFIKPDIGHYELQLAATHVDAVRGVLDAIRPFTSAPVMIGDAGHYGTLVGFRHFGYEGLPGEYDQVSLVDLQEGDTLEEEIVTERGKLVVRRARAAVHADVKISLASLKTHRQYGVCLSVANWAEGTWIVPPRQTMVGRVFTRAPWLAAEGPLGAHSVIEALYRAYPADVGVIDGVLGMEGDGPTQGTAIHVGAAIASMDPLAVDAVGSALMGIDTHAVAYLHNLAQYGLGTLDLARMDIPLAALREHTHLFQLPFEQKSLRN